MIDFKGIQFFSGKAMHLLFVENYNKLLELRDRLRIVNLSGQIPGVTESLKQSISVLESR